LIKLLHGNDEFSSKETLNEIIGDRNDPDLDLNFIYSSKITVNEYKEYLYTISLFAGRRILVFYDLLSKVLSSKSDQWKDFIDITISKPNVNEVIFIENNDINLKSNKIKKLSEIGEVFLYNIPVGRGSWEKIKNWIIKRQDFYDINISPNGINKLIDLIGSNYRYLDNELFKLSNFKPNNIIEEEDIELMVSGIKESSIFELIDSLLAKNIIKASVLLEELINNGQTFFSIQQMLSRQIRLIIITQELLKNNSAPEIQSKIQIKSNYAFNKIFTQAKQFSPEKMKEILKILLELDLSIKGGHKKEKDVLQQLVYIL
jgi:DNA polymerase III delta subunit|tara:strand:+ start:401 stop:1351 length:951 start_codon:yes stop_codon:yes gene_type:complete